MSKAFDKMDRGKLIDMLGSKGINYGLLQIINILLSDRYQSVRVGNNISQRLPVINGIPQETLLGPVFWLLYVASFQVECDIIKYADDLTLSGSPAKRLNYQPHLQTPLETQYLSLEDHVDSILMRIRPLNYTFSKLKRSGMLQHFLIRFYLTFVRPRMTNQSVA